MEHAQRWAQFVSGDGVVTLDRAAAFIAERRYPGLDAGVLLDRIDALAAGIEAADAETLVAEFCGRLGFRGDTDHYDDERNSMLNDVLDRRKGLPIALCALVAELGRRTGVDIVLVGMPGRVLVTAAERPVTYYDPFGAGVHLDAVECARLFTSLHGPSATFRADMLAPTPPMDIVVRMLSNLVTGYLSRGDWTNARWALEMRAAVPHWPPERNVDLAVVLARLGMVEQAAAVWDEIASVTSPRLAAQARERAARLRAGLN
ncbi:MAG: transglutaminase family protein [Acidimicrobiales bacterium]